MATRQEEKERLRLERMEQERAAAKQATHQRRTKAIVGVGVAAVAVLAVVLLAGGGGGSDTKSAAQVTTKARAARCQFHEYPSQGRNHVTGKVNYRTNPPTSGPHNPAPAADGPYAPGSGPAPENLVHALEHGRVEFQFKPGTPRPDLRRFAGIAAEPLHGTPDYHVLVFENNTSMPTQYAVTAWRRSIQCSSLSPAAIDAMRAFRKAFTDKAPEQIP